MAIIPSLPGLTVEIRKTTGEPFQEYPDNGDNEWASEYETPHKTLQFVECVSGARFRIYVRLNSNVKFKTNWIRARVIIGGASVAALRFTRELSREHRDCIDYVDGASTRISPTQIVLQHFTFNELEKVDDGDTRRIGSDVDLARDLGDITVEFHHSRAEPIPSKKAFNPHKHVSEGSTQIAEKALKGRAISHSVGYGAPQVHSVKASSNRTGYPDGKKHPFAVFLFKYRSRDALQSELIIPRSPTPELKPQTNLQLSATERLARVQQEMDQVKAEIKREDLEAVGSKHGLDEDNSINDRRAYKAS